VCSQDTHGRRKRFRRAKEMRLGSAGPQERDRAVSCMGGRVSSRLKKRMVLADRCRIPGRPPRVAVFVGNSRWLPFLFLVWGLPGLSSAPKRKSPELNRVLEEAMVVIGRRFSSGCQCGGTNVGRP